MTLGEFIKNYREEHDLSIRSFASMVGISTQQISNIEKGIGNNGKPMSSTMMTYKKIADGLGIDENSFLKLLSDNVAVNPSDKNAPIISTQFVSFPIIGEVAAHYDGFSSEDWTNGQIDVPLSWLKGKSQSDYFVLRVSGDSMYPAYQDGDLVLVLKQSTMDHSGQVGVIMYDDDKGTLKRVEYVMGEDWMKLIPINPQFPPITIRDERLEHCRVLGVPKKLIRNID